jgi:hypothetical protein
MDGLKKLIHLIKHSDDETAEIFLKKHLHSFGEGLIERSWTNAQRLLKFQRDNRKKRLRGFILEESEYDGSIGQLEFLKFFASIVDFLEDNQEYCDDVGQFAREVEDFLYIKIGKLKIDRRQLFSKQIQD